MCGVIVLCTTTIGGLIRRFSIFEFLAERTQIRGIELHMTHFEHHHRDDTRRWQFIKASTVAINSTLAPPQLETWIVPPSRCQIMALGGQLSCARVYPLMALRVNSDARIKWSLLKSWRTLVRTGARRVGSN